MIVWEGSTERLKSLLRITPKFPLANWVSIGAARFNKGDLTGESLTKKVSFDCTCFVRRVDFGVSGTTTTASSSSSAAEDEQDEEESMSRRDCIALPTAAAFSA